MTATSLAERLDRTWGREVGKFGLNVEEEKLE